MNGSWNYPTSIRFGAGRIRELPDACRELGRLPQFVYGNIQLLDGASRLAARARIACGGLSKPFDEKNFSP